jgi:flagellar basal body-associated protein FliL
MEDLDLLKKDWNKDTNYPTISEQRIYVMLHKNSSSTVQWIFIISLIELSLGIVLGIVLSFTKADEKNTEYLKKLGVYTHYEVFMVILYSVVLYFIVRFYLMYKKVSTTDSTKQLMKNILQTRKTVQNYILFNIIAFAIGFIALCSYGIKTELNKASIDSGGNITEIPSGIYLISLIVIIVATGILTVMFWFVYKLIYGFLLKKLKKNYEELKKIDL